MTKDEKENRGGLSHTCNFKLSFKVNITNVNICFNLGSKYMNVCYGFLLLYICLKYFRIRNGLEEKGKRQKKK